MADDANLVEALAEQADAGEGVVLEIFGCATDDVSGGLTKASIVVAEGGDAGACQRIGNYGEGLVLKDFFIAVLETAAGDHDKHRCLARITLR